MSLSSACFRFGQLLLVLALLQLATVVHARYPEWNDGGMDEADNRPAFYERQVRFHGGDVFNRLNLLAQMMASTQQQGCRAFGDSCSWNEADNMQCCYNLNCRCNIVNNCQCK
uniref:Uncharacterized protein n=1 Tax=Plectus sambesii TaxID=2011161 RepID=A0A914WZT8_9BILA